MPTPHHAPMLRARPLSQLVIRPLDFLWHGRLPLGKLALLDGDPGLGKSMSLSISGPASAPAAPSPAMPPSTPLDYL